MAAGEDHDGQGEADGDGGKGVGSDDGVADGENEEKGPQQLGDVFLHSEGIGPRKAGFGKQFMRKVEGEGF